MKNKGKDPLADYNDAEKMKRRRALLGDEMSNDKGLGHVHPKKKGAKPKEAPPKK